MDKINPAVTITLDRERRMVLDLNAMVAFEEQTGKSLLNGRANLGSASELRAMLWACLKADDPALTIDQVGALITVENMGRVAESLAAAVQNAMPEAKKDAHPLA